MLNFITFIIQQKKQKNCYFAVSMNHKMLIVYFRVIYYPFGERDPKAEYTLQVGDWVQFNVATDRRDNLQRATNIELLFNGLTFSKEKREQVSLM